MTSTESWTWQPALAAASLRKRVGSVSAVDRMWVMIPRHASASSNSRTSP